MWEWNWGKEDQESIIVAFLNICSRLGGSHWGQMIDIGLHKEKGEEARSWGGVIIDETRLISVQVLTIIK